MQTEVQLRAYVAKCFVASHKTYFAYKHVAWHAFKNVRTEDVDVNRCIRKKIDITHI